MKRIFLAIGLATTTLCALGQNNALTIPVTNINKQGGFPAIHPDNSVEFQVKAPEANHVQVDICGQKYSLKKDGNGVWTGKTAPQVPGFHYYSLVVDGVSVADPASESFYGCSRMMSAIDIPEDNCDDFETANVPHGQVRELRYFSNVTNSWRPMFVYTPASYEQGSKTYPVIYIHHGGGEDHRGWVEQGRIANIMDNLIASGKATEAIVVSVNSNVPSRGGYSQEGMAAYAKELTENIIPFVEKTFRCKTDAKDRAMCGLSMGGGQSFYIGLPRPTLFRSIGIFSSGIFGGIAGQTMELEEEIPGMLTATDKFNSGLDLFYISCGEQDPRISHTRRYTDLIKQVGVNVYFNSFPGDHEWQVWRKSFHEFAQKVFKQGNAASQKLNRVYDETINPLTQIDQAVAKAKAQGKHVICQVGGNWCVWCLRFADFITKDTDIAQTIDKNFVFIHVNYPRDGSAKDLLARLGNPGRFGYPVFVVLDGDGKILHTQDSSFLEEGQGYDKKKTLRFFNAWTPEAVAKD